MLVSLVASKEDIIKIFEGRDELSQILKSYGAMIHEKINSYDISIFITYPEMLGLFSNFLKKSDFVYYTNQSLNIDGKYIKPEEFYYTLRCDITYKKSFK